MSSIRLQIMSDLHLETPQARPTYEEFEIQPQCRFLALLGDIGSAADPRLFGFLEEQLRRFEIVFFLLGNHEPYGMDFSAAKASVRAFEENMERRRISQGSVSGRFVFLDRTRYDLTDSVTILGCTLFSCILPEQRQSVACFVSDFSNIIDWTVDMHCAAHDTDVNWLNSQVAELALHEPERSIAIFTHHSPTTLEACNDPRHMDDSAQIRSAFVTDISNQKCWTSPNVGLWAFGHTHFNCDVQDPQTNKRVVANQKGYRRSELATFDISKVVDVAMASHAGNKNLKCRSDRNTGKLRPKRCIIM